MKVSVSLPREDIEFLDAYASAHAHTSRSAVVHQAISAFRFTQLNDAYSDAWDEWTEKGDAELWDATTGDGL